MSGCKTFGSVVLIVALTSTIGCGSSGGSGGKGASMDEAAGAIDAQNAIRKQEAASKAAAEKQAADERAKAQATPPQAEPARKVGDRPVVAGQGYYGAIIGARRHVMNVVDAISWIQGVRSFKAEEGRKPKDTAEFMNVVVKRYDLQLPRIEADEEYAYDPNGESDGDFGQLYVVKKEPAASSSPAPAAPPVK